MINSQIKEEISELSPEMKLMLLLSIREIGDKEKAAVREILREKINWRLFVNIVEYNRIYPVVYKNIVKMKELNEPEYVLSNLREKYKNNMLNLLKFTAELIRLMDLMKKSKIRALPLKGPLLGINIYGDVSLRTSKDLDILIHVVDMEKAEKILLKIGYRRTTPDFALTLKQKNIVIKKFHHYEYYNEKLNVQVELHWRYDSDCFIFDFEKIWEKRKSRLILGNKIDVLSPEDNFVYLTFHGAKHGWFRLKWLCDTYEIVKKNKLDWKEVIEISENSQISRMLFQTMILLQEIFKLDIPNIFGKLVIDNKKAYKLAQMAIPIIKNNKEVIYEPKSELYIHKKKYMIELNSEKNSKIKYILQYFFPTMEDFKTIKLKDDYFFLYFIIRPFLWAYRFFTR
ncbi:nucleotidyltransferase family protein [Clostridium sp. AWRP]|uniref:nucleotidyltransferase domain-containing protein n=1 Tax=Clostridium sp. AWRP TaxID=2212991 RepID=UPI000FD76832|nr:nucleotidyltransferase family protein [Clostridium sp. AWRP]AZV56468.1 hypothetical protein DMR38_07530 [Clostridium sp. AWRP]